MVAVNVDEYGALGALDLDRKTHGESRTYGGLAALVQRLGVGTRKCGDDLALGADRRLN
jgi:hypothetical protein